MSTEDISFTEFLDDYFAESEEHLASVRRHLLVLEVSVNRDRIDPEATDAIGGLLYALHSLKGLSGMVGIREVEQVAHAMETSLRDVQHSGVGPSEGVMDALAHGTSAVEQVIAARREQKLAPDITAILFLLTASRSSSDLAAVSAMESAEAETVHETTPAALPPGVVRVDMTRLDDLMTMVGDLVVSRVQMEASLRRLNGILPAHAWRELQEANLQMQRRLRNLREGVLRARMVPIGQIFERMRFAIRGLERESQKEVRLELAGQNAEIDKHLVERMMDPLLHMVRNAVRHGLESSEERVAQGKSREGHIRLSASTEAETVVIELEDDGRGMDIEMIAVRSRKLGLMETGDELDNVSALQMICAAGFSTREEADLGSGRGIGMTIVKATVHGLGGTLAMDTRKGKGTRFTIRLPLTLAIMQALVVYLADQPYAVPRSAIHEVLRVETSAVRMDGKNEVIPYHDRRLPIVHLHRFFGKVGKSRSSFHVFVAGPGAGTVGIAVDRIAGQPEIVVRSFEDPLLRVPGIAGATDLGDGRPVLILDVAAIVDAAHLWSAAGVQPS